MTFTGAGATTITSSTSTYTGGTTVNAGTVFLSGSGSLNNSSGITINGSGAKLVQNSTTAISAPVTVTTGTLDGTTMVNSVVVGNGTGGIITNGGGTTNPLFVNSLTFSGAATMNLNISSTFPALTTNTLNTSGGGAVSTGLITINASNASWSPGVYYLINYSTLGRSGIRRLQKGNDFRTQQPAERHALQSGRLYRFDDCRRQSRVDGLVQRELDHGRHRLA